jgi:RND family efflux transporter MFP subunit
MPLDQDALQSLRRTPGAGTTRYDRSPRRRRLWIGLAIAALIATVVLWRVLGAPTPVQTVLVESPSAAADGAVLNASGYVVARRLATVSSKVTGRISEVLFEEGARVTAGQVLARLDPATALADQRVAASGLEAARRGLREIEVRLADARKTLGRNRSLVEKSLVSRSVLDAAEAEVAALEARLESARADVGVAEARLAVARQDLDDLEVRAPFAGVVISKDAQPGETVSPMSAGGGFTRTGIATIVDMDSREIEVDVNEAYINRVRDAQTVEATLDAYPDWKVPGRVISIVPTADRQKATVRVRIAFDELDPRILPDMGIKVRFLEERGDAAPPALKIPVDAVVRDGESTSAWVVRDGRVERRVLKLGDEADGEVAVLDGLQGGETLVSKPSARLRDGGRVELQAN